MLGELITLLAVQEITRWLVLQDLRLVDLSLGTNDVYGANSIMSDSGHDALMFVEQRTMLVAQNAAYLIIVN